jgi:large subunit ribosomal protein L31e
MAKKEEPKAEIEREYNVPLRKGWLKSPKYKRAKKAVKTLKEFLQRHMKSENVKIGKYANLDIWKRGIKNPPHHIKVKAVKDSEGIVRAEIVGAPEEKPKEVKKAKKKAEKTEGEKAEEKKEEGNKEEKPEAKEEKKEAPKEEKKEEVKEKPAEAKPKEEKPAEEKK